MIEEAVTRAIATTTKPTEDVSTTIEQTITRISIVVLRWIQAALWA